MSEYTEKQLDEIDAMVAEHIFGYRWVQAPQYDYEGPLPQQGKVLVPPTLNEAEYQWAPRGIVHPFAFTRSTKYTRSGSAMLEVVEKMVKGDWYFTLSTYENGYAAIFSTANELTPSKVAATAPLAVALAALQAVGHPYSEQGNG